MALLEKINHVLNADLKQLRFRKEVKDQPLSEQFIDQLYKRRSIYRLGKRIQQSQSEIATQIQAVIESCPSPANSQSTSVVILMGPSHLQFWQMVESTHLRHTPSTMQSALKEKIQACCDSYGTVLFFEDQQVIERLQKSYPFKAQRFVSWSEQVSGMAQYAVWVALANMSLGAALHHYHPEIDYDLREMFNLSKHWKLKAQLVFGSIEQEVDAKEISYMPDRIKLFT